MGPMGPMGQIMIVVGTTVLFILVVRFIARMDAENDAQWLEEAEKKGFKAPSEDGKIVFDTEETELLKPMSLSRGGYRDSTMDPSELNLRATLITRRQIAGKSESLFMYRSIGGRASIQRYGTALLMRRESQFSMSWFMAMSGETKCDNSSEAALEVARILDAADWIPVASKGQHGRLAGFDMTPRAVLFYVSGVHSDCVTPLLNMAESIIAELEKS